MFYYRGLKEWDDEKGYLTDTCLSAQDRYKAYLNYFRIEYEDHNLVRAKDQLALFMDMKKKKTEMDKIIADLVK